MTRSLAAALLIAASVSLAAPQTADAQLGGLIKKKVKDAITKPDKPAEPPPAATGHAENPASPVTPKDGLPRVDGNSIVLSKDVIARVMRGMDSELALLADFEKVLSKYPTIEEYEQCKSNAALTPEGMKAVEPMMHAPPNMTQEQSQAIIAKMNLDMEKVWKKKCPNDPNDWPAYEREKRIEAIHDKAASMARAKSVSSTTGSNDESRHALLYEVNPFDVLPDSVGDTVVVIRGGGLDGHDYSVAIERVVQYCVIKDTMDVTPKKGGLSAPGEGNGIVWIYNQEELEALYGFDCAAFKKKYHKLIPYWK